MTGAANEGTKTKAQVTKAGVAQKEMIRKKDRKRRQKGRKRQQTAMRCNGRKEATEASNEAREIDKRTTEGTGGRMEEPRKKQKKKNKKKTTVEKEMTGVEDEEWREGKDG